MDKVWKIEYRSKAACKKGGAGQDFSCRLYYEKKYD